MKRATAAGFLILAVFLNHDNHLILKHTESESHVKMYIFTAIKKQNKNIQLQPPVLVFIEVSLI